MEPTSLSFLKGSKKSMNKELSAAPEPEPVAEPVNEAQPEDDGVTVDVSLMDDEELQSLVDDNNIEVPDHWIDMSTDQKKIWLTEQFDPEAKGKAGQAETVAEEPVKPVKQAKAKAKGKSLAKPVE